MMENKNDKSSDMVSNKYDISEEECRVCRGLAEEGRPLFKPCKCSGSIGLTHQDCLTSWLAIKNGDCRCDLCATKFKFAPKYAPDTPDLLPLYKVLACLTQIATIRWLPYALRILLVSALWLFLLPLTTAYLYLGWIKKPLSIMSRWQWDLVLGDVISGAVVSVIIIVSFLSLMSFADFLRFHWQQDVDAQHDQGDIQNDNQENVENFAPIHPTFHNVNTAINNPHNLSNHLANDIKREAKELTIRKGSEYSNEFQEDLFPPKRDHLTMNQDDVVSNLYSSQFTDNSKVVLPINIDRYEVENLKSYGKNLERKKVKSKSSDDDCYDSHNSIFDVNLPSLESEHMKTLQEVKIDVADNSTSVTNMQFYQNYHDHILEQPLHNVDSLNNNSEVENINRQDQVNNVHAPPHDPLDPIIDRHDDGMNMDIHIALDELVGLRGPVSVLLRNLLWVLAFNMTYLGFFAFIPYIIGTSNFSKVMTIYKRWSIKYFSYDENIHNEKGHFVKALNVMATTERHMKSLLQLHDIITIIFGYLCIACTVFLLQCLVVFFKQRNRRNQSKTPEELGNNDDSKKNKLTSDDESEDSIINGDSIQGIRYAEREGLDNIHRHNLAAIDIKEAVIDKLIIAQECAAAMVKIGILLFLKMLLLPLLIGFSLDIATLDVFENTLEERFTYAEYDMFSAVLLHWVVGITFMLIATVSVLQLREVVHPDLLARIIRPQEPQPDLLGVLLKESGFIHMKRMMLSLIIYFLFMLVHIWLPTKILFSFGLSKHLSFFHPKKYYYFLPQLQVPIELMIFHLLLLSMLEKYKNYIGKVQHKWLLTICEWMDISDYILPKVVVKFELFGYKNLFHHESDKMYNLNINDKVNKSITTEFSITAQGKKQHFESVQSDDKVFTPIGSMTQHHVLDPFWTKLLTLRYNGHSADSFIEEKITLMTDNEMISTNYEVGTKNRDGRRVLHASHSYILLPYTSFFSSRLTSYDLPLHESMFVTSTKQKKILIPTVIGSYRLRMQKSCPMNNICTIEFWRECLGEAVPRPPPGWDDLSIGGAEVQGRWAWGNERRSELEESIGQRKRIFSCIRGNGAFNKKWKSVQKIVSFLTFTIKFICLFFASWMALLIFSCVVLSLPLLVGRFVFYLLRTSDCYIHDPLSYVVGVIIVLPISCKISSEISKMKLKKVIPVSKNIRNILKEAPKHSDKIKVVFVACFLWFFISPLLLGLTYNFMCVKGIEFWLHINPLLDRNELVLSWGAGMLLLNMWAAMCYIGAFHFDFWMKICSFLYVRGQEGVDRNDNINNQSDNYIQEVNKIKLVDRSKWQGQEGIISRFFSIISSVIFEAEWDIVDSVTLLDECAIPITFHLLCLFITPIFLNTGIYYLVLFIWGGDFWENIIPCLYKMIIYRIFTVITISFQLATTFQQPLKYLFISAHNAARNDRYLIGEELLNYGDFKVENFSSD